MAEDDVRFDSAYTISDVHFLYFSVSDYLMGDIDNFPTIGKTKVRVW